MLKRYRSLYSFTLVALINGAVAEEITTDEVVANGAVANETLAKTPSELPSKAISVDTPIDEPVKAVSIDVTEADVTEVDVKKVDDTRAQVDKIEHGKLLGKKPKDLKLSVLTEEPQINSATPAPKQAENIDLKEVVEEPLEVAEPVDDQTPKIDAEGTVETTSKIHSEESVEVLEPAENIDLNDVVEEPLRANEPATESEKVVNKTEENSKSNDLKTEEPSSVNAQPPRENSPTKVVEQNSNDGKPNKGQSNLSSDSIDGGTDTGSVVKGLVTEKQTPVESIDSDATNEGTITADNTEKEKTGLLTKLAQELTGKDSDKEQQPPLLLLNSEVLPGTSTRLGWSPSVSFIGISAPTAVLVLNGVKPGPTLCLTAAVHGDELNGIEVVRRVLYDIDPKQLSGAVIGVPIVNLQGFRRSSRYLPDRRDLNRFFPGNPEESSAARIAYSFFSEVITHCDMLIDLHTGSFRRTNLPQLRANLNYPNVASLAEKLGAIVVVQSEGAVGSLRRAAVENGIASVTLEAGAPHELQKDAVEHGVKSIESAMDSLGMIKRRRFWERSAEPVYYKSTWVRAREGGILFSEVSLGARVKQGDVLGVVTDPITNMRSQIVSPFDGRVIGMALNQVMFPGFAAYHIGLKASVEETPEGKVLVSENDAVEQDGASKVNTANAEKIATKSIKDGGEKTTIAPVVDEIDPVVETEAIENIMPPAEDSE